MSIDVTPAAPRARRARARPATLALLVPVLLVVIAGLVALWPGQDALNARGEELVESSGGWFSETVRGTLLVDLEPEAGGSSLAEVRLDSGEEIRAPVTPLIAGRGLPSGTRLVLMHSGDSTSSDAASEAFVDEQYWVQDVDRAPRLWILAAIGAAAVIAAGRWRGLRALVAVATVGALTWFLVIPHVLTADRPLAALAVTAVAACLAVALTAAGLSRRAALIAWAMIAGGVVAGVLAWLVAEYLILDTAVSVGSIAFSYLGMEETPVGLYEVPLVLAGLAGLTALVPTQVRLIDRGRRDGAWRVWPLVRASGPALQRILLVAGLLASAFLLAPALSRRILDLPGATMQFLADLDIGLALVLTTLLTLALATPLTAAVALALDRRIARSPGAEEPPSEPTQETEPAGQSEPTGQTEPAGQTAPAGQSEPPRPSSPATSATPGTGDSPAGPVTAAPTPTELRPAPRRRPEAEYRRPGSDVPPQP